MFQNMNKISLLKSTAAALLICCVYMIAIPHLKPVRILNLKLIDSVYSAAAHLKTPANTADNAVLVAIDDESLKHVAIKWPWPRAMVGSLIKEISNDKPSLILADLAFIGASPSGETDTELADIIKDAGNVFITAYFGSDKKYIIPEEVIARSAVAFGFVNKPTDEDMCVRRMRASAFSAGGDIIDYSLQLKAACYESGKDPAKEAAAMPKMHDGTAYINFTAAPSDINKIPVWEILEKKVPRGTFSGKMVFLGMTSELFHDSYITPLGKMAGVIINLNETMTYLGRSWFSYIGYPTSFTILFFLVLISVILNFTLQPAQSMICSMAEIALVYAAQVALFLNKIVLPDMLAPILLIFLVFISVHGTRYLGAIIENARLKKEAITDGLTGLYVFKYFELKLKSELSRSYLYGSDLALLIFDLDRFKNINDTYGHDFGNKVLKKVADTIKRNTKKDSIVSRYGGEEFCIILPDTDKDEAGSYGERIRILIKGLEFIADGGKPVKITISCGIAVAAERNFHNHTSLLQAADAALYRSKNTGRDKVTFFEK